MKAGTVGVFGNEETSQNVHWFNVDTKCALARLAASRWEAALGDMCLGDDNCMV